MYIKVTKSENKIFGIVSKSNQSVVIANNTTISAKLVQQFSLKLA